jgi:hypothetical protein
MTVVTADLVEAHRRISMLEALATHLRYCRICAKKDVENCLLGKTLWEASGYPLIPRDLRCSA